MVRTNYTAVRDNGSEVAFKSYTSFGKCFTKIDGTDDAEILELVILIYNLLEYSSNYPDRTCSLWFSSWDGATNFNYDNGNNNTFKSFKHKAKLLSNTVTQSTQNKNEAIAVPLKRLKNFWWSIEMRLINCKREIKLK